MAEPSIPKDVREKPIGAVMDDVMRQSQAALESGARAAAEMNELRRRTDEALDWRKQLERHSWLTLGLAAGVSVVVAFALFRKR